MRFFITLFNKKINIDAIIKVYLLVFFVVMFLYCSINTPMPTGEWDDYSLPVASLLNDHNFSINDSDIVYYKELFGDLADWIGNYSLSGYVTKDGAGQMTWYFPTYSIACVPLTILLKIMKLPTIYAFYYTNLAVLTISLYCIYKFLAVSKERRLLLILATSINPICFYISWISAEVFIYSMLLVGLVFWYNRSFKRAAFFVSIAGMLNPTIMSVGIIMIVDYFYCLVKKKSTNWLTFFKDNIRDILLYGSCYIVGIIPMIYNYYNTGHINLTASLGAFSQGTEGVIQRAMAYLLDLNFGILPYYPVVLVIAVILMLFAFAKKEFRYLLWLVTFVINVLLYSIMVHINCGMSGIARYNAWGCLILLFAVIAVGGDLIIREEIQKIYNILISSGIIYIAIVVFAYNPFLASNTTYLDFTPIAAFVLDKIPSIYNPLHSTFNNRVNHIDGGYEYKTPIIYCAEDGYVRKVLATAQDKEMLAKFCFSEDGDYEWFLAQTDQLTEEASYISVPKSKHIEYAKLLDINNPIIFSNVGYNASDYVVKGTWRPADWGCWVEDDVFLMRFRPMSSANTLHMEIDADAYNQSQKATIFANGEMITSFEPYEGDRIEFDFSNPGYGRVVEIRIDLPNGVDLSKYNDFRIVSIGIKKIVVTESIVE